MTDDFPAAAVDLSRHADFDIGPLTVRPASREVVCGGVTTMLEPRVMQTLVALWSKAGEVVSREALIDACWSGRVVTDDAINRVMVKVRRLGAESGAYTLHTIPRVGYRLAAAKQDAAPRRRQKNRLGLALALVLLVVAGAAGFFWRASAASAVPTDVAVVLEPFEARPGDAAAQAFALDADRNVAGLLAENNVLVSPPSGRGPALRVRSDAHSEGDQLKVRVRLSFRDAVLWSREFTGPADDPEALRYEIGWRLTYVLSTARSALSAAPRPLGPVTLGYYLQFTDEVSQGNWNQMTAAEALVKREPKLAAAHLVYASSLLSQAAFASPALAPGLRAEADAEIARAEALDPESSAGIRAFTTGARQWSEREAYLAEAARLDEWMDARPARAKFLIASGRVRDGALLWSQTPPESRSAPGAGGGIVASLRLSGRVEEARAVLDRYLAMRPSDTALRREMLNLSMETKDYAAAEAILARPDRRPPPVRDEGAAAYRATIAALRSNASSDRAVAAAAIDAAVRSAGLLKADAVVLLARLGALDEAFAMADAYAHDPRIELQTLLFDPSFLFGPETRAMREDARFIGIADALGLLDYWRATNRWPDFCEVEPRSVCATMQAMPASD